jgi:hypothetical protein
VRALGSGAKVKSGLAGCALLALTEATAFTGAVAGFAADRAGSAGFEPDAGHLKSPFCRKKTSSFSFSALLPRSEFKLLQHATQFSSALLPPFADATRCSTLASAFESGFLQK